MTEEEIAKEKEETEELVKFKREEIAKFSQAKILAPGEVLVRRYNSPFGLVVNLGEDIDKRWCSVGDWVCHSSGAGREFVTNGSSMIILNKDEIDIVFPSVSK